MKGVATEREGVACVCVCVCVRARAVCRAWSTWSAFCRSVGVELGFSTDVNCGARGWLLVGMVDRSVGQVAWANTQSYFGMVEGTRINIRRRR